MRRPPVIVGGLCLIGGYVSAWALRKTSPVSAELRAFHRREQMDRLRGLFSRRRKPVVPSLQP
jgi:hypothetical protein